jgi:hypothetical protein
MCIFLKPALTLCLGRTIVACKKEFILMCNNGDNMNVVFYDGDNFPDKKTFERTAYVDAIMLKNGEILGFRDNIIYQFMKGKELKFARVYQRQVTKFILDKFGNVFFLEAPSKITKIFRVESNAKMKH